MERVTEATKVECILSNNTYNPEILIGLSYQRRSVEILAIYCNVQNAFCELFAGDARLECIRLYNLFEYLSRI